MPSIVYDCLCAVITRYDSNQAAVAKKEREMQRELASINNQLDTLSRSINENAEQTRFALGTVQEKMEQDLEKEKLALKDLIAKTQGRIKNVAQRVDRDAEQLLRQDQALEELMKAVKHNKDNQERAMTRLEDSLGSAQEELAKQTAAVSKAVDVSELQQQAEEKAKEEGKEAPFTDLRGLLSWVYTKPVERMDAHAISTRQKLLKLETTLQEQVNESIAGIQAQMAELQEATTVKNQAVMEQLEEVSGKQQSHLDQAAASVRGIESFLEEEKNLVSKIKDQGTPSPGKSVVVLHQRLKAMDALS